MSKNYDVVIIGTGIMGASIFYHLTASGFKVAIIEKNSLVSGCTSWSGGVVRCFHLVAEQSDKAVYSWNYYTQFEKQTGEDSPFTSCGFLYFPHPKDRTRAHEETMRLSKKIPIEWLEPSVLKKRFGELVNACEDDAIYEPESGYMDPVQTTRAWLKAGQKNGGVIYDHTQINAFHFDKEAFQSINTNKGSFSAQACVIATGASSPALLDSLGIVHDLYAQMIQVDVRKPLSISSLQPAYIDDVYDLNGRPFQKEGSVYIGYPTGLRVRDDKEQREVSVTHSDKIKALGLQRWSWVAESHLLRSLRAADCYSPDALGRVMKISERKGLYLATGFNGGGFKMAPWIGKEMQRLISSEVSCSAAIV